MPSCHTNQAGSCIALMKGSRADDIEVIDVSNLVEQAPLTPLTVGQDYLRVLRKRIALQSSIGMKLMTIGVKVNWRVVIILENFLAGQGPVSIANASSVFEQFTSILSESISTGMLAKSLQTQSSVFAYATVAKLKPTVIRLILYI